MFFSANKVFADANAEENTGTRFLQLCNLLSAFSCFHARAARALIGEPETREQKTVTTVGKVYQTH